MSARRISKGPKKARSGLNNKKTTQPRSGDKPAYTSRTHKFAKAKAQTPPRMRSNAPEKLKGEVLCRVAKLGRTFGFVAPLDESPDIFVAGRYLKGAMPGDEVLVAVHAHPRVKDSREGEVIEVVKQANAMVGQLSEEEGVLWFTPSRIAGIRFAVENSSETAGKAGDEVAVEIVTRGERHDNHVVKVLVVFGSAESAKSCAEAIVFATGVPIPFSDEARDEAAVYENKNPSQEDLAKREDWRNEAVFTIDSASTKDIDDAISVKRIGNGYELAVHIADVSHYVTPSTALNKDAFERGTSIYYANKVVPMLPQALSNGICSLNPGVDRLAFSCIMQLDENASVASFRFEKTAIQSKMQGVYTEVNDLLKETASPEIEEKYASVKDSLLVMHEIYKKLISLRVSRGNIDIESDEPYIVLDENEICIGIEKRSRGDAEKLIEEFMLLANGSAAAFAREKNLPFVYRVHEKPVAAKVEQLKAVLTAAGVDYSFVGETPTQQELAVILNKTRGTSLERFIHTGVLRTMAKAKYEPIPKGHFGLALDDYAHFTSPIRRYPDLSIHRVLSSYVDGMSAKTIQKTYKPFVEVSSSQSTICEQVAQTIERNCDDSYKAEYMRQFIGDTFEGVISSVMVFGLYVALNNTVEGMVHTSLLSTSAMVLAEHVALTDPLTGKRYQIGDSIKVRLLKVDIAQGNIDFGLADE